MDRQLRQDLICERVRDITAIRRELANQIRLQRVAVAAGNLAMAQSQQQTIDVFKWILNHDLPLDEFYRKQYNKDIPQGVR